MQISQQERMALFDKAREMLGADEAGILMELLPPNGWGEMATKTDLYATAQEIRGEMAEVRGEMAEVRGEMAEVRGEMAEVRGEMAEVRSELVRLEGRMDVRFAEVAQTIADQTRSMQFWIAGSTISIWLSILLQNALN